jgi:putative peptidoglycan lipid II flippase
MLTTNSLPDSEQSPDKPFSKSLKKSLSIATAIMMGSVLLSRIAGLFREQVLAHYGGTSFEMDAYVTAFLLPELLNHFLAGGFLSITFIPIFQRHFHSGNREKAWISLSNLITIGSILFLILIPLSIIFTPAILQLMGKNFAHPDQFALTVKLTRIILPAQIFFYWGAFFSAVQMAEHKFFLPALSPLLYNVGIIAGGIILGPVIGIEGFAWGVLIGAFAGNVLLQLPGALRCGMKYKFTFNLSDSDFSNYIRKTVPLILGLGMTFSNEIFFRFFGSFLPEGGTSSVNYALRTTMMVVAVFGQASGVAFFPYLSKMAIEQQFMQMSQMLHSLLTKIATYLVPLSSIMLVVSYEIISILFKRGHFTESSALATASVFSIYLLGTFSFSASIIIARSFYALENTLLPMLVSTGTSLLSIPLYFFLCKLLGAQGIALAAIIGITLQFLILYFIWINKFKTWKSSFLFGTQFAKIIAICSVGAVSAYFIKRQIDTIQFTNNELINNLLECTITAGPALLLIFVLYEITGIQKLKATIRGLLKRK